MQEIPLTTDDVKQISLIVAYFKFREPFLTEQGQREEEIQKWTKKIEDICQKYIPEGRSF